MMDDRTLLERAAKAAGYTLKWGEVHMIGDDEIDCTDQPYVVSGQPDEADWYWDPLNDDGDALRLAVKLQLLLIINQFDAKASDNQQAFTEEIPRGGDPYAATRRAIVRAAAEIGTK